MATVFVATCDTYYATVAVADTYERAEFLAAEKALEFLTASGDSEHWSKDNTVQDIIDYFAVTVTKVEMDSASYEGDLKP